MLDIETFDQALIRSERRLVARLTTPSTIQAFLDEITYSAENTYRCPLRVMRERICNCFDGALFAVALLRRIGNPPLILNMIANDRDDDHLLALLRRDGYWGAVSKANFAGLRFREPIYRNLRELVMSYFEQYYNVNREKTLRGYSKILNLEAFDKYHWMTLDEPLELIATRLDKVRNVPLLTNRMLAALSRIDERSYRAGLFGANEACLFRPAGKKHERRFT